MNKSDFIKVVAETGNYKQGNRLDKVEAERALNAVLSAIELSLNSNESIELIGFGKFENIIQKGKAGKIPGTDTKYETQDKLVPKFKPGKAIRDSVAKLAIKNK